MSPPAPSQPLPVSWELLVQRLAEVIANCDIGRHQRSPHPGSLGVDGNTVRVLLDGADPTRRAQLADDLVDPLRVLGRPALRARTADFLRPGGVRLEHGRQDPDALYDDALDLGALTREVLDPLGPGGDGQWLPSLWDPVADRATRASRQPAPDRAVLLLDGPLLLRPGLACDVSVHLHLSPAALVRQLPADQHWQLPAYARHAHEADPRRLADLVVLADRPDHLALIERASSR